MNDHSSHPSESLGLSLVFGSMALDWFGAHGLSVLSAAGMVVGLLCTLVNTLIRVVEFVQKRKAK